MLKVSGLSVIAAGLLSLGAQSASATTAPFDIQVNYLTAASSGQQAAMNTAAKIWEYLLVEYQETPSHVGPLVINATFAPIDGGGGTLGFAGPSTAFLTSSFTNAYVATGAMTFDTDDIGGLSQTSLLALLLHEMAHVIGFGTFWDVGTTTGLTIYDNTDAPGSNPATKFTGANAVAAYNAETGSSVTEIALETSGGSGTAGGHWDEVDGGLGGPTDINKFELMSGWLNPGPQLFVSSYTVASFADIGYGTRSGYSAMTVDQLAALVSPVPLPGGLLLAMSGLGMFAFVRRRKSAA